MNKFNWKMSFLKMPTQIDQKLRRIPENEVVVACVRKIPASVLADGGYGHLGMSITDDTPWFSERVTPPPGFGRFSTRNCESRR